MVQEIYSKMRPVSCTNTHHDVTNLVNHGMNKNAKTWISRERNITFLSNKKIINLCLRWLNLRSYRFAAEITFKRSKTHEMLSILCTLWINVHVFFISNAFSIQPQCCWTFFWIELQMLLRCYLIHITINKLRDILYLRYGCFTLDPLSHGLLLPLIWLWECGMVKKK